MASVIEDDDVDRISREIKDWKNPEDLKKKMQERFPKWKDDKSGGKKRIDAFVRKIVDKSNWKEKTVAGKRYQRVEHRTMFSGKQGSRIQMIIDKAGKYLGKPENVKTYTRHNKVFGLNLRTGRRAEI